MSDNTPSLAERFRALVGESRADLAPFRPGIEALNGMIAQLHEAGVEDIGLEYADFSVLRKYNLMRKSPDANPEKPAEPVTYGILHIHDAQFLLRLRPDSVVDCFLENLNRPTAQIAYLDSDDFWTRKGKKGEEREAKFFQCDLKNPEGREDLISTVLQTAATCTAVKELAGICVTKGSGAGLRKIRPL